MEIKEPKMLTPEEMAKIQKERTLSDAKLINGGAEYASDKQGGVRLDATSEQKEEAKNEMAKEIAASNFLPKLSNVINELGNVISIDGFLRFDESNIDELKNIHQDILKIAGIIEDLIKNGGKNYKEVVELNNGWTEINKENSYSLLNEKGELFTVDTPDGKCSDFGKVCFLNDGYFIVVKIGDKDYLQTTTGAEMIVQDDKYGNDECFTQWACDSNNNRINMEEINKFIKKIKRNG